MAAPLKISNSAAADLALEEMLVGGFGFLVLLAGLELWDLGFLDLVGILQLYAFGSSCGYINPSGEGSAGTRASAVGANTFV